MQVTAKAAETDVRKAIEAVPGINERQIRYVLAFISGKSKSESAELAGYSPTSSSMLHRSAAVQAAIAACVERYLHGELLPLAFNVATRLLLDDRTPHGVRSSLALGILDRAGFDAKRHQRLAESGKDVSQMSADELQASIDKLQAEIDGRMKDVTPNSVPDDAQDVDLYP